MTDPVGELDQALARHVRVVRQLVEVAQDQQRHLIGFDVQGLASTTHGQEMLLAQLDTAARDTVQATTSVRASLGLEELAAPTVRSVAIALGGPNGDRLATQCDNLRSLLGALDELHRMSLVQASRGLRVVDAYAHLLASTAGLQRSETYTPRGRARKSFDVTALDRSV